MKHSHEILHNVFHLIAVSYENNNESSSEAFEKYNENGWDEMAENLLKDSTTNTPPILGHFWSRS